MLFEESSDPTTLAPTVEVLLPLRAPGAFSYRVPPEWVEQAQVGCRVVVQFGASKRYTGIVVARGAMDPHSYAGKLKTVEQVVDPQPVASEAVLDLYQWIAEYYLCAPGEVLKAALPSNLKLESQTVLYPVDGYPEAAVVELGDREYMLFQAVQEAGELPLLEAGKLLEGANARGWARKLAEKGLITLEETLVGGYRARTLPYLELAESLQEVEAASQAVAELDKAPAQQRLLLAALNAWQRGQPLSRKQALEQANTSASTLQALLKKGCLRQVQVAQDRLAGNQQASPELLPALSPAQQTALARIRASQAEDPLRPVLLYGITGSGKTLLYIDLIQEQLAAGKQVLYLLPEIGLTNQIIRRLRAAFGEAVGVYHSRFNANERVEIWLKVLLGEYRVVVGVRSAVLLPFTELGLVVVDEEHDASYKQHDPAPRYHARDTAVAYARRLGLPIVLGSATPSLESWENARRGKYQRVDLLERPAGAALPERYWVDLKAEEQEKLTHGLFTSTLLEALAATLERGEQAILFKNRRGYSPYISCSHCGHTPHCHFCDIALTYHKHDGTLRCHYCGFSEKLPRQCASCGNPELKKVGIGTERLEEHLQQLLPQARLARMDQDTTRGKHAFDTLMGAFARGDYNVLLGTQMVTKGLDFPAVTLVGVLNADDLLQFPDFRAEENAYQLLTQVAGRAGRAEKTGRVLIQTRQPTHPVYRLLGQPYTQFVERQRKLRHEHAYPPYTRLIQLELRHTRQDKLQREGERLRNQLIPLFPQQLAGPTAPPIARLKDRYRLQFLIRLDGQRPLQLVKASLQEELDKFLDAPGNSSFQVVVDVDPRG